MTVRTRYVIEWDGTTPRVERGPWLVRLTSQGVARGSKREISVTRVPEWATTWVSRRRADERCAEAQDKFPGARVVAQEAV